MPIQYDQVPLVGHRSMVPESVCSGDNRRLAGHGRLFPGQTKVPRDGIALNRYGTGTGQGRLKPERYRSEQLPVPGEVGSLAVALDERCAVVGFRTCHTCKRETWQLRTSRSKRSLPSSFGKSWMQGFTMSWCSSPYSFRPTAIWTATAAWTPTSCSTEIRRSWTLHGPRPFPCVCGPIPKALGIPAFRSSCLSASRIG